MAPVFMSPSFFDPSLLVYALRGTSQSNGIRCEFFSWDLSISEEDLKAFCYNFVKNGRAQGVFLYSEKEWGRVGVYLVGFKAAFDYWRPFIAAEIQKMQKHILPESEPFKVGIMETKIFHEMKTKLEAEFQVQISFESDNVRITPATQEAIEKVFRRVKEMREGCRVLELPFVFCSFLLHQGRAKLHVENEIEKLYNLKVHLVPIEEKDVLNMLAFEEKGKGLGEIEMLVNKFLFLIPSEDALCQLVFSTESGKALFAQVVQENEGKLSIIVNERTQMCCVGTKDIEEKVKKRLLASLMTQEYVELPSEEVWNFCEKYWQFDDIQKNFHCEVKLAKDVKFAWAIVINGQMKNVSHCHQQIAIAVGKIDTKPVEFLNFTNGFESDVIKKLNEEKRCFVNLRSRTPIPWKKWIERRGSGRSLTYSLSFDTISVIGADDLKITLLPEEQSGAKSKKDFQSLDDDWVQMFVPSMGDEKKKDTVSRKINSILNLERRNILVDCERLQEKELKYCMKLMCYILNERVGKDLEISKCEFHDTRQEMFCWMTEIIDKHLNNKNVNVMEWKGRIIDMDVQEGQLAHQKVLNFLMLLSFGA
ncbi:uncharacterized protein LOC133180421 [Saccostrea echinata]|uniref:uncharacterized protein LOC133180421 n=1 Tax=Saccostrea echinata TaxID=191078 RepID=UPI002A8045FB|nr:uncharacterized protein LOC133180421 [Saccostrea echinata]